MKRLKLLIIGLDGAAWSVVEPLARAGRVPNLARIMGGVRGSLESTIPPVTPSAWTSFMTGKNPGKHGLYHFVEPEPGGYAMRYTNARSRKATTIWRLLSDAGCRVGVVNVPMTFPPEAVDGFMISGMDTPDEGSDFVYPRTLLPGLREAVGPLRLEIRYLGFMHDDVRRHQVLRELREIDEQRIRMILHLLHREPVDVLMVVYGSPDTVQHYFWHYADSAHYRHDPLGAKAFGWAIQDVYERLDRHIGRLMQRLGDDGVVMVVSDHGFGPTSSRTIYLNRYLAELGLLSYRQNGAAKLGRALSPALNLVDRTLRSALSSKQKKRLARLFPALRSRWERRLTAVDAIDWSGTKAYCSEVLAFPQEIWVNLKGRQPHGVIEPGVEYDELLEFLSERIMALKDPLTGERLVRQVFRKHDVYQGPYVDQAPDLMLAWWEGDGFNAKVSFPEDTRSPVVADASSELSERAEWTGTHRLDGILAMHGAGMRTGQQLSGARIIDLAPTILYLLGQPVPDDMDGSILTEAFEPEYLARRPVGYQAAACAGDADAAMEPYSEAESEIIRKRLQDLGYVE